MRTLLILSVLLLAAPAPAQFPCVNGLVTAGQQQYPCHAVDLMALLSKDSLGAGELNDVWGWTDPDTGQEYALVGAFSGTVFVDITDPVAPVIVGSLPSHTVGSIWRDIKVYADHAFIVSEAPGHGLQVFDLSRLDTVTSPPVIFTEDAHTGAFGHAHNIAIDEQSGMAYVVGTDQCSGGLFMFDVQAPTTPVLVGCHDQDGYIHDTQCVVYQGPDPDHQGARVCFSSHSGADKLSIVDVTDPTDPQRLSIGTWSQARIGHQGWLSEDHRYFFIGDEGDETFYGHPTRTRVFDVTDLDAPVLLGHHDGTTGAIDHNMYAHANLLYQANYRAGLQVLDILDETSPANGLPEVAHFDVFPSSNAAAFNGAWSVYPYFPSGHVVVSGIEQGLFVLRPPVAGEIRLRVLLQGPWDGQAGLMRDDLRAQALIPLIEPYTALGYVHTGGGGGEATSPQVLAVAGPDAIVDWVVVELRKVDAPAVVIASRSALLTRNGTVVDMDGMAPVSFDVPMGRYHVAIRHRNHLGVMSARPLPVGASQRTWDLSDGSVPLYGTEPALALNGDLLLFAGNTVSDDALRYTGAANDRDAVLYAIGGTVATSVVLGYLNADADLDGVVKYTGSGNDRDLVLQNIGGVVPTSMREEQLP